MQRHVDTVLVDVADGDLIFATAPEPAKEPAAGV
jgi:hypothetical protein